MQAVRQRGLNEWLVIRCQQGERQALEELLTKWCQRYLLYSINRLRDQEAAKDVTQECMIAIARNITRLKDPGTFPKWSFKILERRCLDWQRKTIRERALIQHQEFVPEIEVDDKISEKLSAEKLLKQIDSRVSTTLRLFYLEGLTVEEIAEVSELPTGTVKSRLFYGRKLLAKAMEQP